jgi:hypothetical protein
MLIGLLIFKAQGLDPHEALKNNYMIGTVMIAGNINN